MLRYFTTATHKCTEGWTPYTIVMIKNIQKYWKKPEIRMEEKKKTIKKKRKGVQRTETSSLPLSRLPPSTVKDTKPKLIACS